MCWCAVINNCSFCWGVPCGLQPQSPLGCLCPCGPPLLIACACIKEQKISARHSALKGSIHSPLVNLRASSGRASYKKESAWSESHHLGARMLAGRATPLHCLRSLWSQGPQKSQAMLRPDQASAPPWLPQFPLCSHVPLCAAQMHTNGLCLLEQNTYSTTSFPSNKSPRHEESTDAFSPCMYLITVRRRS